ncbi:MAG: hypothetical protein OXB84_03750 [Halobacteriovoraceae bacterium]|nr:hypothetical protein [Halobacteriovoraceae bacterium]
MLKNRHRALVYIQKDNTICIQCNFYNYDFIYNHGYKEAVDLDGFCRGANEHSVACYDVVYDSGLLRVINLNILGFISSIYPDLCRGTNALKVSCLSAASDIEIKGNVYSDDYRSLCK